MNEHEEIAQALKARLSELRTLLAKVDHDLHKPLPADSQDQAIELENQEALEVIKKTETTQIHQIEAALKRISEGTYGTCAKCGEPIDSRRGAANSCYLHFLFDLICKHDGAGADLAGQKPPDPDLKFDLLIRGGGVELDGVPSGLNSITRPRKSKTVRATE